MTTTDPTAAAVLALLEKATPGEWTHTMNPEASRWIIDSQPAHAIACGAGHEPATEANAAAIVAAVNYMRSPAFAALLAENERLREAGKAYLRTTEPFNPMLSGRGENPEWQARAALVAALAPRP